MITFQFTTKDGKHVFKHLGEDPPEYCKHAKILVGDIVMEEMWCDGKPKVFQRHFSSLFPNLGIYKTEYHIQCGDQDIFVSSPLPWRA